MGQYDVYRVPDRDSLMVDCQSDLLAIAETRFVIPLIALADAPRRIDGLNPIIEFQAEHYVLATQLASAVRLSASVPSVGSLANRHYDIIRALDVLLGGV